MYVKRLWKGPQKATASLQTLHSVDAGSLPWGSKPKAVLVEATPYILTRKHILLLKQVTNPAHASAEKLDTSEHTLRQTLMHL